MQGKFFRSLILTLAFISAPAVAAPTIVVSIPPLHSLVKSLMEGVAEPVLLIESTDYLAQVPATEDLLPLVTADLIIWAGPGYESALSDTFQQLVPSSQKRLLTLGESVPLLAKAELKTGMPAELLADRAASRDYRFWMDHKLAIMAVRQISPRLALLDPDNLELYLDNEIALVDRLRKMGQEITSQLQSVPVTSALNESEHGPYFAHRYIVSKNSPMSAKTDAGNHCKNPIKLDVSMAPDQLTEKRHAQGRYFNIMHTEATRILIQMCTNVQSTADL